MLVVKVGKLVGLTQLLQVYKQLSSSQKSFTTASMQVAVALSVAPSAAAAAASSAAASLTVSSSLSAVAIIVVVIVHSIVRSVGQSDLHFFVPSLLASLIPQAGVWGL